MQAETLGQDTAIPRQPGREGTREIRIQLHCPPPLISPTGASHCLNPFGSQRQEVHWWSLYGSATLGARGERRWKGKYKTSGT